jgi:hypothetical protein
MAEMIATYPSQGKSSEAATAARVPEAPGAPPAEERGGYLNEVRSVSTMPSGPGAVGNAQG